MGRVALLNARVIPVSGSSFHGGVVVEGNRIAFVGTDDEIKDMLSRNDRLIDLDGMVLMPGFIDAHIHPFGLVLQAVNVDLSSAFSLSEVFRLLKERVVKLDKGEWLIGRGWDDTIFTDEKRYPGRSELDRLFPDNPVMVVRVCGHVGVVNTPAMNYLSKYICSDDPDVDWEAGVVRENALELAWDRIPLPSLDVLTDAAKKVFNGFFEKGLTTVVDMGGKEPNLRVYHNLKSVSSFPFRVRVYMMPEYLSLMTEAERSTKEDFQDVRILGLKILSDGSLGARTAYLDEPYSDAPDTVGVLNYPPEEIRHMVELATKHGLQTAIHAIGDGAARVSVDAFEAVKDISLLRPRLEHCQVLSEDIVDRMVKLGVIASVQPIFVYYDAHWVEDRIGRRRLPYSYAWKKLKDAGLKVVAGSDAPVCPYDPVGGMLSAMTQKGMDGSVFMEEEKLDFEDVLKMYTIDAAYSIFEEGHIGSLEVGKLADIVVLSDVPSEDNGARVVLTMVDGRVVFSSL